MGTYADGTSSGVFTARVGALRYDFFVHLLDMATEWSAGEGGHQLYVGVDRSSGERRWTATRADLVFGSNAQLRAVSEVYAQVDGEVAFVRDFINAWVKVMELDRFDQG